MTATMAGDVIWANSGDSHVLEPDDIWAELPAALRERAPYTTREGDTETLFIDGVFSRRDPIAFVDSFRPPGARDLTLRMDDLDAQGIWAEVVFPSTGIWVTLIQDRVLYNACARAYNEWCAATVNAHSDRLVGVAILSHIEPADALTELEHCIGLGYQAVSLSINSAPGREYNRPDWDPFWAAASEARMPVCFHAGTGVVTNKPRGPGGAILNYVDVGLAAQSVVTELVAGGALDRYPGLRVFLAEVGSAWAPALADRMDEAYRQHGAYVRPKLSMLPSELVDRQVFSSFQHDRSAVAAVEHLNLRNVMWGSDYPHLEGTYPRTQEVLHELFDHVDESTRLSITVDSFNELFDVPAIPAPPRSRSDRRTGDTR